jgi:hypothetical protein
VRHETFTTVVLVGGLSLSAMSCGDGETSAPSATAPPTTSAAATTELPGPTEPPGTTSELLVIDYEGGATYVTGRIADFRIDQGNISTDDDGGSHSRDGTINYRVVSDDPRVTGTVSGTWSSDRWGAGITNAVFTQWGVATLTNDNGTWEAPYEGAFATPYGDIVTRWWRGAGDYEGLTFYMWVAGSEVGSPDYEWAGIIFPGDPPPVSEFTR